MSNQRPCARSEICVLPERAQEHLVSRGGVLNKVVEGTIKWKRSYST